MTQQPLMQLAYISDTQDASTKETVAAIHQQSERNNRLQRISGVLLVTEQHYLQVLEGLKRDVELTFERIQLDKRHHHIRLIYQKPISQRQFPQWDMGLRHSLADSEQQDIHTLVNLLGTQEHFSPQQVNALTLLLATL